MPELPEAEHTRRKLDALARGRTLVEVEAAGDDKVFETDSPARFAALVGRRVVATGRHGKYIWMTLDRPPHVVLHLGMSGALRAPGDQPLPLESSPAEIDRSWPPKFTKLRLRLDDGQALAFTNPRRLGKVLLRDDPPAQAPIARLGFDPLKAMPDLATFSAHLGRRRGVLKGLLLNQGFAAGVGNWIADEVCFQAGLDPRRSVDSLSAEEKAALHRALTHVVATAVEANADKNRFPKTWLFHRRWGKGKGESPQTAAGDAIEHIQVAGRTTAWVPARQR